METLKLQKRAPVSTMLDPKIVIPAITASFVKLDPRLMIKNPVMFVVEVVAALTTVIFLRNLVMGGGDGLVTPRLSWLWVHGAAANFAEAVAEGRGKAQAETLRKTRNPRAGQAAGKVPANALACSGTSLKVGDVVLVPAWHSVRRRSDRGRCFRNEAAITGESAPVIRGPGGDRSAVTGGTQVLSDWIRVRITAARPSSIVHQAAGSRAQKTLNEIALNILLRVHHHLVFATVTILSWPLRRRPDSVVIRGFVQAAFQPSRGCCLRSARWHGPAGAFNVLACRPRSAAGDVDLPLDKTGTITLGTGDGSQFRPRRD
jgi:K+-transporting ATPase ATPase B chain